MPRRKKGKRSFFDRRKNDTKRCPPVASKSTEPFTLNSLVSLALPNGWERLPSSTTIQVYKIEKDTPVQVKKSILLKEDFTWTAYYDSKQLVSSSNLLKDISLTVDSFEALLHLVRVLDTATVCPGNPEDCFVALCKKRGGSVRGERGCGEDKALIEHTPVVDIDGQAYACTLRRKDCELLCCRNSANPQRCSNCQEFRATLRSSVSRLNRADESLRTASSSHTKYISLGPQEKTLRLKNLRKSVVSLRKTLGRMELRAQTVLEDESVSLHPEESADVTNLIAELTPAVQKTFAPDSPQHIFWQQQCRYNELKEKRQMKWHPLLIRFALNLKYLSSTAYRAIRESGMIALPSERTLYDYTHWVKPHSGVQYEFVEHLKSLLESELPSKPHQIALSMDEMKIKNGLVFNKHTGTLTGFVDLGTANEDIERLLGDAQKPTVRKLADHAFVFMARAIFKPSLTVPVAHYFSTNLSAEKIFPMAWDVIETLELYHVPVASLTSDGAQQNRRFYRLCQPKGLPYKCKNAYRQGSELYFFCDVPHLLKTTRNCFSNSFSHSKSRKMEKKGEQISWKAIESLYLSETTTSTMGVRLCHKLTRDHIWLGPHTRMRVYLAAQVMSESVASCLEYMDRDGTDQTRLFIRMVDRFFDYLNVKSPKMSDWQRKESRAPYKDSKDERLKWLSGEFVQYLDEWDEEIASKSQLTASERQRLCLSTSTKEGLRLIVKSFTELAPKLLKLPGADYLLSEVFSQDPLERYFSKQRHRGGSNENPLASQVPFNASTLIQQRAVYKDVRTMNVTCENSSNAHKDTEPLKKRQRRLSSMPLTQLN